MTIQEKLHTLLNERHTSVAEQGNTMLDWKYGRKAMCASINVENKEQNHQKPPRSLGRIACEILAGTAAGFAVAVPVIYLTVYVIVRAIWGEEKNLGLGGFLVVGFIFLAFPPLYGPASAVGVYLVGNIGKQTGSFLPTLRGGFLGGLIMFVMLIPVSFLSSVLIVGAEKIVSWTLWALVLLIPPIVATSGFNSKRRYKEPPSLELL